MIKSILKTIVIAYICSVLSLFLIANVIDFRYSRDPGGFALLIPLANLIFLFGSPGIITSSIILEILNRKKIK